MLQIVRNLPVVMVPAFLLAVPAALAVQEAPGRKGANRANSLEVDNGFNSQRVTERPAVRPIVPESARMEVAWGMVRSRLTPFGATSRNENFKEVWHLWRRNDGGLVLISPRAKVAVHQATPDQSIVTTEGDLATLLGLLPRRELAGKALPPHVTNALAKPLSIHVRDANGPVTASFQFGDEETYAIQLEVHDVRPE
jgi:hypothetical protein